MTEQNALSVPGPVQRPGIAICGFAEGHLKEAPFGDPQWEAWGINRLHTVHEGPWHRWFNLHDLEKFHGEDNDHLTFLKNFQGPVYLRPQDIGKYDIPNAVPFPWTDLVKKYGGYFNNTISWLLAYALEQSPQHLGIFGVDMAQDSILNAEYSHQRPSCEYFIGIAAGQGITIHLPKGSDLLKTTHLYGFEDASPFVDKMLNRLQEVGERKEKAKQQLANLQNQAQQLSNGINQLDGAMQDIQFWLRNHRPMDIGEPFQPNGSQPVEGELVELEHASQTHNG